MIKKNATTFWPFVINCVNRFMLTKYFSDTPVGKVGPMAPKQQENESLEKVTCVKQVIKLILYSMANFPLHHTAG